MTNYRSPSFDPKTGLFIVDAHPSYSLYFAKPEDGDYGWAGADYGVWGKGVIEAIDYQTGKIRWSHDVGEDGSGAGVLTTASGLTFTGDAYGNVLGTQHCRWKSIVARRHRCPHGKLAHYLRTRWSPGYSDQQWNRALRLVLTAKGRRTRKRRDPCRQNPCTEIIPLTSSHPDPSEQRFRGRS